jgi:hypothetical protein
MGFKLYFDGNTTLEIQSPAVRSFIAFILCFHPRMVYVILQHDMSLKMGYVTRGQSSDYVLARPYRKYDNPPENTILVVFPGYGMHTQYSHQINNNKNTSRHSTWCRRSIITPRRCYA